MEAGGCAAILMAMAGGAIRGRLGKSRQANVRGFFLGCPRENGQQVTES